MITATSPVGLAASTVAVLASAVFVATIRHHRRDPATRPIIGIAVTLLAGAVLHLAVVDLLPVRQALGIEGTATESPGGFWTLIAFDVPAVVGVFWFLFALQYTGRDRKAAPIAFSAVAVLLVLLVGPSIALSTIGAVVGVSTSTLNTVLGTTIVLAESLALIGVFLLCATTLRHKAFPAAQTVLLTLAVGAILTLPFVATSSQSPIATPVAVTASAVLFTTVVRRHRVFETLPVVSVAGRDRVIDEMADGVVLVAEDGSIRDVNSAAESLFGVTRDDVASATLDALTPTFPTPERVAESGGRDVRADTGRTVAVTAEPVTDDRDRDLGYLVVCRDVTEERRREHRLGVLTTLVADATTEQMRDVTAVADGIAAADRAATTGGERILETATDTATLVGRVRRVERALADQNGEQSTTADVHDLVTELEDAVDGDVTTPADGTAARVSVDRTLVTAILETLAAAAGTADTAVDLRAARRNDVVTIELAPYDPDGGSVIPDIALDIARLAAEHAEWTVETADADGVPTVCVRLPVRRETTGPISDEGTA